MAEHGTRTMYVHYKCRCDECCKAEHEQYLKRKEQRKRNNSKWSELIIKTGRLETQRKHNANRYKAFKERPSTHTHRIVWKEIAEINGKQCAICGIVCDENDMWIGDNGRKCYGRKYPTVDHIVSLKNGGADLLSNVQLLCKHCNSSKGSK